MILASHTRIWRSSTWVRLRRYTEKKFNVGFEGVTYLEEWTSHDAGRVASLVDARPSVFLRQNRRHVGCCINFQNSAHVSSMALAFKQLPTASTTNRYDRISSFEDSRHGLSREGIHEVNAGIDG